MPGLKRPELTITIDRRRMIATCTLISQILPKVDGSDRPFPPQFKLEGSLENHDAVRLKLLYTFDPFISRVDLNRGPIGVRFTDTIACSLLNEDKASKDEIIGRVVLMDGNGLVFDTSASAVVKIDAMSKTD